MNIEITSGDRWSGRKGLNLRFKLQIWNNYFCMLPHPTGVESNGYEYWEIFKDEICGAVLYSKSEIRQHTKEFHKELI